VSARAVVDRAAQRALVERYASERPGALLHDPTGPSLLDVASGKTLLLDWGRLSHVAEGRNGETGAPFLTLLREDGRQIVLADVGVAFEPLTASSGPLPGLPPVVCFRDFAATEARLVHYLRDHPEDPVTRSHLDLFFFLIAVLDGARAVGFDVSREERRLEALLREIEVRRAPGT
jgi:hypothetical protein